MEKDIEAGIETLDLKTGEKFDGTCIETEIKDNYLPVMSGKVGKNVEVLRGSGCNRVIFKRELVDADFIGEVGHVITVD